MNCSLTWLFKFDISCVFVCKTRVEYWHCLRDMMMMILLAVGSNKRFLCFSVVFFLGMEGYKTGAVNSFNLFYCVFLSHKKEPSIPKN